jgi:predicted alpha/beta hydrolase family esterase
MGFYTLLYSRVKKHTNSIIREYATISQVLFMKLSDSLTMHLIYIPGLGDRYDIFRTWALKIWEKQYGIQTKLVPMQWKNGDDTLADKLHRVEEALEAIPAKAQVIIIGESAGASIAIQLLQQKSAHIKVITLCGKLHRAHTVSYATYARNPGLRESLLAADESVKKLTKNQKKRCITIYNQRDPVVSPKDATLAGVRSIPQNLTGHIMAITFLLFIKHRIIGQAIHSLSSSSS